MSKFTNLIYSHYYNYTKKIKLATYSKSKHFKKLNSLKNIHLNKRCFIVGNGPSLTSDDLSCITEEISFAFNRIYHIFQKTTWRPLYYLSQDDKILMNSKNEIDNLQVKNKFLPTYIKWENLMRFKNAYYYKLIVDEDEKDFSDDLSQGVCMKNTVVYSAIQFAAFMGIKEIYLIGVDHNFNKYTNKNGDLIIDNSVRNYFTSEYDSDSEKLHIPRLDESTQTFIKAKNHCEARGIKLYNATRGGKLEVFERVNFDDIKFDK